MSFEDNYKKDLITKSEIKAALDFCVKQIITILPEFTYKFQPAYSIGNFYAPSDNTDWTNGFWTGEIWLAYEYLLRIKEADFCDFALSDGGTVKLDELCERLVNAALTQVDSFYERIDKKISVDHHDMGFLYSPSCVAAYKLTGSLKAKEAAIMAADQLITRFHEVGEFIQAWGPMDAPENYRLIIDCLLNLPLLYWASDETGDDKYRNIAERHINTALSNVIREDYSTWHTFFFDMKTGKPDHGATCQGYRDASAWARGQAWGIYGLAIGYRYTGRKEYIDLFKKVTKFFLDALPEDLVPYWDLEFASWSDKELRENPQPKDSSSASIAACGMLEMARFMEDEDAVYYREIAAAIMKSVYVNYAVRDVHESNGLVLHSTYSNHSPYNTCNHYGVDECNSWGDYFYMEALTRLSCSWKEYW